METDFWKMTGEKKSQSKFRRKCQSQFKSKTEAKSKGKGESKQNEMKSQGRTRVGMQMKAMRTMKGIGRGEKSEIRGSKGKEQQRKTNN
jgi:hypothetical protein